MKLALLTRRFDPEGGGTERDLMITARYLLKAGYDVTAYASEIRGESRDFPVKAVHRFPLPRTARLLAFAYGAPAAARNSGNEIVLSFARTVGADILRSGGSAHASYLRAARRWRGAASAAAMRFAPYHRTQMMIERMGFRSPRLRTVIAVSHLVRDDLISQFALEPSRVVTLYNGVDLERFRPAQNEALGARLRTDFRISASAPVVLFVGNGFGRKGLRFLIEAMTRLSSGAHLVVIGNDRAAGTYEELAWRLGLAARVHFVGARSDVESFFNAANVFAMPSLFEPFGNVVMEAMASGLPVLTSVQSGVAELMPGEMDRYVVKDPTDPAEIARALAGLIEAGRNLGELCRATAEHYSWARHGENLLRILRSAR